MYNFFRCSVSLSLRALALHQLGDRRLEVVAGGLPLHDGAPLTMDTTLVLVLATPSFALSPLDRRASMHGNLQS